MAGFAATDPDPPDVTEFEAGLLEACGCSSDGCAFVTIAGLALAVADSCEATGGPCRCCWCTRCCGCCVAFWAACCSEDALAAAAAAACLAVGSDTGIGIGIGFLPLSPSCSLSESELALAKSSSSTFEL